MFLFFLSLSLYFIGTVEKIPGIPYKIGSFSLLPAKNGI